MRIKYGLCNMLVVFLCFQAGNAHATKVDRLNDALFHAYIHNPTLRAERAEVRFEQESYPQALSGWLPTIDISTGIEDTHIDGTGIDKDSDGATTRSAELSLSQPIYRGGRTFAQRDEALYEIYASRAELANSEQGIFVDVATAYMDVIRDKATLELQKGNEEALKKRLELTQKRFTGGEVTATDVEQAKVRVGRAKSSRLSAEADLASSIARYEEIVVRMPGDLQEVPAYDEALPVVRLDEALSLALERNPEVVESKYIYLAALENVKVVNRTILPQLSLDASSSYDANPQTGDKVWEQSNSIGLTASIPLFQAGTNRSRTRAAKQRASQRKLQSLETQREIRQELTSNWRDYRASLEEIEARKLQVEAAILAREGIFKEAEAGERTVLDTLDAEQELLDAQVGLVVARRNSVVSLYELKASLGLLTSETLGFSSEVYTAEQHFDDIKHNFFSKNTYIDNAE